MVNKEYEDKSGQKFLVAVPEGFEDMIDNGIIIGPPDLESLNLPKPVRVALNNQLFERKLFTWSDVRLRPAEIEAALRNALRVQVRQIKELYMEVKDAKL